MRVLVVTPTLGQSPWLDETVASVAAQPCVSEHVLVAAWAAVSELAQRHPRTTVVPEPMSNRGMYAAINAGIAAARPWDAFTYLNDDDLLLPAFGVVARALGADAGQAWVAYGGVRLIGSDGRRLGAIPISPAPEINRVLYAQRIEPVYQHGTLIGRAAYEQLGGFDESLRSCGDSEYLARACLAGVPFVRATRAEVAAFRLHAGQQTKVRERMIAERRRVDEKLGLPVVRPTLEHRLARWRFRIANLPIYAERIARHGFVSFDEMLTRGQ